jgi:hypothetical protein
MGDHTLTRALRALVLALILPLAAAACEGPTGPRGPTGPPGEATRFTHIGVLDQTGWGEVLLPAAAGTMEDPPLLSCYVADDTWYWYVIHTDFDNDIFCVIEEENGRLYAVLDAPTLAGWWFAFVVIY